jgi:colanic acid/amylovoran biosynthesis glycosyltransferase
MVEFKGIRYLVESIPQVLKDIQNVEFIFVGSGPEEQNLKNKVLELDIKKYVSFLGFLPPNRIEQLYHEVDIFVLPSIIQENGITETLGVVLCEAQASRLPVVATRVGGIPEIVDHGKSGILVEQKKSDELASSIIKLLLDENLRKKMGEHGRTRVEERFNVKKRVMDLLKIYRKIVD